MLKLTKKGDKYWLFEDSQIGLFSPSKFTINLELNEIVIVYENGLKSKRYNVIDCEIYDLGELSPFTTSSGDLFMQKLEELNCPCFQKNENIYNINAEWGGISGNIEDQTDLIGKFNEKLSNDISTYDPATTPLDDTDKLIVFQSGVAKEVAKSELGGNIEDNLYKSWFFVASSTEASGLIFSGIVTTTSRFIETGTRSLIAPSGLSRKSSFYFQNYLSASAVGSNCGIKQGNSADGCYRQGFDNYFLFANNDTNVNCQTVVGLYSLLPAIPNLAISSFTGNFVGVGNDVGDTNLSFYAHRVGVGASYVKIDCGVDFPAHDTTSAYLLRTEAPQTEVDTERFVKLTITNLITGATFTHTFDYTQTPLLSAVYATTVNRLNRNTGVATNIQFGKIHVTRKNF